MSAPHQHGHDENDERASLEEHRHVVPPRVYLIVGTILLIFTALTVWASFLELGVFNPIIALFIACVKATIVVLFFMHVKYSTKLTKLTVGAGLFTFLTLIAMTLADYFTRAWGRW